MKPTPEGLFLRLYLPFERPTTTDTVKWRFSQNPRNPPSSTIIYKPPLLSSQKAPAKTPSPDSSTPRSSGVNWKAPLASDGPSFYFDIPCLTDSRSAVTPRFRLPDQDAPNKDQNEPALCSKAKRRGAISFHQDKDHLYYCWCYLLFLPILLGFKDTDMLLFE